MYSGFVSVLPGFHPKDKQNTASCLCQCCHCHLHRLMATASKAAGPVCLESVGGMTGTACPFTGVSAGTFVVHLWSQLLIIWVRTVRELFNPDLTTCFSTIQPIFWLCPDCPGMIKSHEPKWICAIYECVQTIWKTSFGCEVHRQNLVCEPCLPHTGQLENHCSWESWCCRL